MISLFLVSLILASGLFPAFAFARTYDLPLDDQGPTRNQALIKSLIWPGLGQIAQGREIRGSIWAGGAVMFALGTFYSHQQYNSAAKDYENTLSSCRNALASGSADAAYYYYNKLADYHEVAEDRHSIRTTVEFGFVLWWAGSLVDTWLFDRQSGTQTSSALTSLPGGLEPVVHGNAPGLAWTIDF
ncbi:MAG: hypothetical protein GY835_06325 [bacterium]|nr:hypothetical protein [bacterium]